MNVKLLIVCMFLFFQLVAYSQDNKNKNKPSWSEDLPEREKAPNVNLNDAMDNTLEIDMGDFDLSNETDNENESDKERLEQERIDKERTARALVLAEQEKQKTEKLANEKRIADAKAVADKLAGEKANANKLAQEKKNAEDLLTEQTKQALEAEKQANKQRIADAKATADKLASEKANADKLAQEKKDAEDLLTEQIKQASEAKKPSENRQDDVVAQAPYIWKKVKNSLPKYPKKASRDDKEGWVEIKITIDSEGIVVNSEVVRSYRNQSTFNKAALNAVNDWQYEAPSISGISENQSKIVKIVFKL